MFRQALEELLKQFTPDNNTQILQYVDCLLMSGETQAEVGLTSINLLNLLGEKGLKVSKETLQFVESQVMYLGHQIGKRYKKLSPERISGISGILSIPAPVTKRDVKNLLSLFSYCRMWMEKYSQSVKFLYKKLVQPEPVRWTIDDEKQLEDLKTKLSTAPVLGLPNLKKKFDLFINVEEGVAYGVLT